MKKHVIVLGVLLLSMNLNAQLLKNLKEKIVSKTEQKADAKIDRKIDVTIDSVLEGNIPFPKKMKSNKNDSISNNQNNQETKRSIKPNYVSKFDFVPGATILYFDNFEKDNIGEAPEGWITSRSAEVVSIEGLEGNWLKLASTSANHLTRSKKQSWGNNFSVEFDLLMLKNNYDPRIDISLINTGGNLVTDEAILNSGKAVINFSAIVSQGNSSRASLYALDKKISDGMSENLPYDSSAPVHISICVQGKRFRMWWNERKLYDLSAVNEEYMPNQLGISFGSVGGTDFFISNIRIAKDVPDTRKRFEEGKLVSNLLFYSGTATLKPESMGTLLDLSKILKETNSPVKIVGHTDSDGDSAFNQNLSEQRANEVKKILETVYNIDKSLLTTEGRGESQPIADNNTQEGKAQNRRVEFIFKPEADTYEKTIGINTTSSGQAQTLKSINTLNNQTTATTNTEVKIQSAVLTTSLPFAQFIKSSDNKYTFIASKEEGNSKENFIKIKLESVNSSLKPETFNFKEINQKNTLYGTKSFAEISNTEAVLYYGATKSPYIYKFSPIIANGHMATYYDESLASNLPAISSNCKFVIEKIEDGKATGYFIAGIMSQGLKPIKKGDAMQETFTTGFTGEIKCVFSNVPIY
ncbi:OmpA family protein [Mariniflexile aquimaris]|uniref:OmpA family protein n=1 Tax=Mariniflexile aquimaris TaxID=881009 RepID=A0ABW3BWN7_9FLAO